MWQNLNDYFDVLLKKEKKVGRNIWPTLYIRQRRLIESLISVFALLYDFFKSYSFHLQFRRNSMKERNEKKIDNL